MFNTNYQAWCSVLAILASCSSELFVWDLVVEDCSTNLVENGLLRLQALVEQILIQQHGRTKRTLANHASLLRYFDWISMSFRSWFGNLTFLAILPLQIFILFRHVLLAKTHLGICFVFVAGACCDKETV